jgi:hypothetical protein
LFLIAKARGGELGGKGHPYFHNIVGLYISNDVILCFLLRFLLYIRTES